MLRTYRWLKGIATWYYHTWEIWWEKLANLANHELFGKDFLTNIHRYTLTICTDCSLFAKFFLTNSFYLYGLTKFSPTKYFPCTVL